MFQNAVLEGCFGALSWATQAQSSMVARPVQHGVRLPAHPAQMPAPVSQGGGSDVKLAAVLVRYKPRSSRASFFI
jgi:hypothetical protein